MVLTSLHHELHVVIKTKELQNVFISLNCYKGAAKLNMYGIGPSLVSNPNNRIPVSC
jgi:hypothetical protein